VETKEDIAEKIAEDDMRKASLVVLLSLLSLFVVLLLVSSIPLSSPSTARAQDRPFEADCICKTQTGYINVFFYKRPDKIPVFGTSVLATAQSCKYTSACASGSSVVVGTVRFTLDGHREDTTYIYKFSMYGQEQK
jgi:hypothetical protein